MRGRCAALDDVRFVTFNIRHGAPEDSYRGLPDKLAEACSTLAADVLALQEVDVGVPRSRRADLAEVVAQATGMTYVFAKARKHNYRGQYGNALLARGTIDEVEVVRLSGDHRHRLHIAAITVKPFREPRNAIIAAVTVDGQTVSVATGHLATEPSARRAQLGRVADRLVTRPRPRVLLGDLNIPWPQAAEWLRPYGLTLAEALTDAPRAGIDHVAVDGLTVQRVETRRLPVSDHAAKIVDVALPGDVSG
jgi:endonuclease/exonuclease/phosphatase family metal-dependent hydrolase